MQVLCKLSNTVSDVRCKVCGQGFLVYWARTSRKEQEETRRHVIEALAKQHDDSSSSEHVHPRAGLVRGRLFLRCSPLGRGTKLVRLDRRRRPAKPDPFVFPPRPLDRRGILLPTSASIANPPHLRKG